MRVGWGFDSHQFSDHGPLLIGGVTVAEDLGVHATSDGDVALHAIADALLGAAALGDIGMHFPSSDPKWEGADSAAILEMVVGMVQEAGLTIDGVDVTVLAESVRIAPHREAMRERLAELLQSPVYRISVKATTTDGLGFVGAEEGIAAVAVATLHEVV